MSDALPPTRRPIRWWPALAILALLHGYWLWVWTLYAAPHRQERILRTMISVVIGLILLLVWAVLFSRLKGKLRLFIFVSALFLVLFVWQTVRIRGVTGDLIPILQWRWTKPPPAAVASSVSPPASNPLEVSYPQLQGLDRNGIVRGPGLLQDWVGHPPAELWRKSVGPAWAGFAIHHQYAVTMEQAEESELTTCRDLLTGQLLWTHADPARYATAIAGEGPRTVPTIRSNRVYTVGATGILNCLNLTNSAVIWSTNILEEAHASVPGWGVSCSPLVTGDKVVVCPGGKNDQALVAYDSDTGRRLWAGGSFEAHYSSPVIGELAGQRQILIFNAKGVSAHDDETGRVLWNYVWRGGHPHITNPIFLGSDRVLVSSGYGTGSELLRIVHAGTNWTAERVWKSNRLKSKFANLIPQGNYVYGLDDGILVCLSLADGAMKWKEGRYGHGQLLLLDDTLLIMAESGEVVLVEANPNQHHERTRFAALSTKTWNPPALAGPYLLVRNDKEAACFKLPTKP